MSTNATINVKMSDGTIKQIYVHYDGYDEHTGECLRNYWSTQELAEKIVSFGDASYIGMSEDSCIFYMRDRDETGVEAKEFSSLQDAFRRMRFAYNYFWNGESWETLR